MPDENAPNKKFFEELDKATDKELVRKFREHYTTRSIAGEMDGDQQRDTIKMEMEYRTHQKLTALTRHLCWLTWILIILTVILYVPSMRTFTRLAAEAFERVILGR